MATAAERRSVKQPKRVCGKQGLSQGQAVKEVVKLGCFSMEVIAHEELEGTMRVKV